MRRTLAPILAVLVAALFFGPVTPAWAVNQDFSAFVASRSAASQPLGSGDKFPVIQSAVTKYIQANFVVTTTDSQTLTNKTISGSSNTLTVLAASQLSGTVPIANGGLGLTSGTSGGVLCFTGSTTLASSAALTSNLPVIGGGAGVCPSVGSVTGNTSKFVTNTGSTPSGQGVNWDANGNLVANANAVFTNVAQTFSSAQTFGSTIGSQNNQTTGTSYTLQLSDCGKTIFVTVGVAFTITTLNSLPVGCTIAIEQGGGGQVSIANGPGATKHNAHNFNSTFGQYAIIGLYVDTNSGGSSADFIITGDGV